MFIQVIQGSCTEPDRLFGLLDRWVDDLSPTATGWLGHTCGVTDDGQFITVVRFESREAAEANAGRPEQGRWWSEAEACFDGPVTFRDCDDVDVYQDGGSDDAGFVQIMQGRTPDVEKYRRLNAEMDMSQLEKMRPDLLGSTSAITADGFFTETIAFTDEESARRGEAQEMPEEMQQQMQEWDGLMLDLTYLDLHKPRFASAR